MTKKVVFNEKDNGKTFVSVVVKDGGNTKEFFDKLSKRLNVLLHDMTSKEIVFVVPEGGCGYSLKELQAEAVKLAKTKITVFNVDLNMPTQRLVYNI